MAGLIVFECNFGINVDMHTSTRLEKATRPHDSTAFKAKRSKVSSGDHMTSFQAGVNNGVSNLGTSIDLADAVQRLIASGGNLPPGFPFLGNSSHSLHNDANSSDEEDDDMEDDDENEQVDVSQ